MRQLKISRLQAKLLDFVAFVVFVLGRAETSHPSCTSDVVHLPYYISSLLSWRHFIV